MCGDSDAEEKIRLLSLEVAAWRSWWLGWQFPVADRCHDSVHNCNSMEFPADLGGEARFAALSLKVASLEGSVVDLAASLATAVQESIKLNCPKVVSQAPPPHELRTLICEDTKNLLVNYDASVDAKVRVVQDSIAGLRAAFASTLESHIVAAGVASSDRMAALVRKVVVNLQSQIDTLRLELASDTTMELKVEATRGKLDEKMNEEDTSSHSSVADPVVSGGCGLFVGTQVYTRGLKQVALNGSAGVVVQALNSDGRLAVKFNDRISPVLLKPENLIDRCTDLVLDNYCVTSFGEVDFANVIADPSGASANVDDGADGADAGMCRQRVTARDRGPLLVQDRASVALEVGG